MEVHLLASARHTSPREPFRTRRRSGLCTARAPLAFALALVCTGSALQAQQSALPYPVKAAADRINAQQISRDVAFLASDALAGRQTLSPGFDAAAKYIADRLRRAGLTPAGDNGTFFRHYTLREATVDSEHSHIVVGDRRLRFADDFVLRSFAGALVGTFTAVYVGHGWTIPARGIDPYAGLDVRGKILLAQGPRAMPKDVEIPQGLLTPGASSVFVEGQKRGAVGIIFLPHVSVLGNWEQMRSQNRSMRDLEPHVPSPFAPQPVTSVLLSHEAASVVLAGEPKGADLMAKGVTRDYPASFELLKPITVAVETATSIAHHPYNVVALLEGTDPALKAQYVTVAAHLDGAVSSLPVDGDVIHNSADDNASGAAGMLSIAEQMVRARPRRSVLFIWDSGEEQLLWGTRHFVASPPVPLDRIVAHFNIDMIGGTRTAGSVDATEEGLAGPNEVFVIGPDVLSAAAAALLARVNSSYLKMMFNHVFDRADHAFFYPRTDAGPFLERGILTIGFTTGIHRRYHLPADEVQFLDLKKIETVARTVFASIWALASIDQRPSIDKTIPATVPRYRNPRLVAHEANLSSR